MADHRDDYFEWDLEKAEENRNDHGVSFEEAKEVFDDPRRKWLRDELNSEEEDRYKSIGFTRRARLLTVAYCERGPRTRIISARKASATEREAYDSEA